MSDPLFVTRGTGLLEMFLAKKRASKVNQLIPEQARKGRILDIGCGSYPFFLTNTKFREKYGLEKSMSPHNKKNAFRHITLKTFDSHSSDRIPFDDDYFNVVTMLAVLEHIWPEKLPGILDEIWRVLCGGGYFIFTTPAAWTSGLLRFLAALNLISSEEISDHKVLYTHAAIGEIFSRTKFKNCQRKIYYFEFGMNIVGSVTKTKVSFSAV